SPAPWWVGKGRVCGGVAGRGWDGAKAAGRLKVTGQDGPPLPADLYAHMRAVKPTDTVIADWGDIDKGFAGAAHVASASYYCPYQSHAPFAPNCALADVKADGALVMSSTQ